MLDYKQSHRSLVLAYKQRANCGIVQPHVIVIYVTEVETHIRHIGTHFIHMPNTVAEHKRTNITNKR